VTQSRKRLEAFNETLENAIMAKSAMDTAPTRRPVEVTLKMRKEIGRDGFKEMTFRIDDGDNSHAIED